MKKDELSALADSVVAINKAKYKAQGYKFRVEMRIYDRKGYNSTKVHYFKNRPADHRVMQMIMAYESTVISDYKIEEL